MCQQREEPPNAERYEPVLSGIRCDADSSTIREAMRTLGPSFTYTLHVASKVILEFQAYVRDWTNAELAHQINVVEDPLNEIFEWYVSANGRKVGSKGV